MSGNWNMAFAIAHRGASQLAPENTLSALKLASQRGATWVECDIQLTRDNQPVIFHDKTLARTTNGHGFLAMTGSAKIASLDAGSWFSGDYRGERVPTLQEWLQCAANINVGLNLEIKSTTKKESIQLVEIVIDHLQKYFPAHSEKIFISSSNAFALMQVAERAKSVPLGLITEKKILLKDAVNLANNRIVSVHQPYRLMTREYVEMLHESGLYVLAYTVNDVSEANRLRDIEMDGIFTDDEKLFGSAW